METRNVDMFAEIGVKKKGKIARVGRINEFQYAESEDGSYAVKAFPMSGFSCKHLIFSREGSRYVSRNEEHDPGFMENDLQDEYVERDNTMDDDNDFTEDIEPVVVHDDDISSREPHAYVGEETGIAVRTNASLRRVVRNLKRGKNGTGNVLQDTALELEGSSCEEIDDNGGVSHKCKYCEGMFSCKQELISHSATCCVQRGVQMAVRGATIAHRLISNEDTRVHWTATDSPALAPFAARISADVKKWYVRKVGSAASPAYGQSLGKNTTSKYANELLEFFKCGARDKRKRVNPPVMLERLREKYPRRYDLPAENFIIRFVSAQNKRLKDLEKRGLGIDELALPTEGRGKRMLAKYSDAINEIVKCSDGEIMPREGFGALISKLGLNEDSLPDDFPTMKTVKNKVSPLK